MKQQIFIIALSLYSSLSFSGQLLVTGESGPSQLFARVYAYRCEGESRGSCQSQNPTIFSLNQTVELVDGSYLLGFENSVYPELVDVRSAMPKRLSLIQLQVPASLKKAKSILVSRNFAEAKEMKKYFWTLHLLKRPMFHLSAQGTLGYYLASANQREMVQRLHYDYCEKGDKFIAAMSDDAKEICAAWNSQDKSRLSEIFFYNSDTQSLSEKWVTQPGDIVRVNHLRHLVSAPLKGTEFVAVFPGSYRFTADKESVVVQATNSEQ